MTAPARIITVGDVVTDVVAVLGAPLAAGTDTAAGIQVTGGGQAANTAAWLAWLGVPVTLVAAVGEDEAGRARLAELAALGVHCAVRREPHARTGTVIVLTRDGERTMITDRGANLRLGAADVTAALAAAPDARHLHLSGYALLDAGSREAALRALAAARDGGLTTSVDAASAAPLRRVGPAAFRSWVRGADLLLANADEAAVLAEGAGAAVRARELTGVTPHVVVKNGGGGAIWASRDGEALSVPARPAAVVDVTGAGDAFAAGLLAAWVAGTGPTGALERATELGARAVARVGARPPGPADPRAR